MKEEEGRRNAAVEAFILAKKSNQELKKKLLAEDRERKSVAATLIVLKSKPGDRGCSFATLRISWPPPKVKSLRLRRNWKRPRRQRNRQRGLEIRPRKMGTTSEWQRPRKPSRLRSQGYVGLIAPKCGMKLSTGLGLRLYPRLGRQRTYTIPLPSDSLFPLV